MFYFFRNSINLKFDLLFFYLFFLSYQFFFLHIIYTHWTEWLCIPSVIYSRQKDWILHRLCINRSINPSSIFSLYMLVHLRLEGCVSYWSIIDPSFDHHTDGGSDLEWALDISYLSHVVQQFLCNHQQGTFQKSRDK